MKDYRSLEQKIRQMRIDEAEARNAALRKKVENVGRPKDDNKDPETSKLAKQGEIKTKIIDEAAPKQGQIQDMEKVDKKSNMSDMDSKEIKGGKTEVVLDPKTDDRPQEQTMEDEKSKKAAKKVNKEQGTKGTIVKEEVLDELSKETLRSYKEKSSMPKKDEQPRQSMNRMVGMARAMRRIHAKDHGINYNAEEVEQVDEADAAKKAGEFHFGNPDDLHAHLKKAHADKNQDSVHRAIKGAPTHSLQKLHAKLKPQDGERQQHRDKELFHLSIGGELKRRGVKEEVEQIDEISKKTAMSAYQSATFVDDEHPKADAIRGHIEKKWGKKMGKHADAHAYYSNYPRHAPFQKDDKLKNAKPASSMRMTNAGKIHKQDINAKKTEIKSRMKEEVEQIDEKNWIAGAIKHKGALHKQLHVPADEPIPAEKLNAAAEKGGKLGQRARLAKTLKRIVKGK